MLVAWAHHGTWHAHVQALVHVGVLVSQDGALKLPITCLVWPFGSMHELMAALYGHGLLTLTPVERVQMVEGAANEDGRTPSIWDSSFAPSDRATKIYEPDWMIQDYMEPPDKPPPLLVLLNISGLLSPSPGICICIRESISAYHP
ncbi:hypothetical protein FEM48_Zijuj03G0077400 [Ziziphus jujuba var. spinosa]|uniref:Uncharacterized protein n=1 Tax=Ziziphus jujuba var. spinosa TaxID=714518 RepID=A0A978VP19_ZIZJJ|nr:hypothetical protein FEM48_Zijuj03G0077400 [Ziziphus jujuba var. spinosa]